MELRRARGTYIAGARPVWPFGQLVPIHLALISLILIQLAAIRSVIIPSVVTQASPTRLSSRKLFRLPGLFSPAV